jgi:hypothetical protein
MHVSRILRDVIARLRDAVPAAEHGRAALAGGGERSTARRT